MVRVDGGTVQAACVQIPADQAVSLVCRHRPSAYSVHRWWWEFHTLSFQNASVDFGDQVMDIGNGEMIGVPLWALVSVVLLPAALLWGADVRLARRRRGGLCLSCGYDRRGLAADAKCPECGTVPT
jgi:hypothetical protein